MPQNPFSIAALLSDIEKMQEARIAYIKNKTLENPQDIEVPYRHKSSPIHSWDDRIKDKLGIALRLAKEGYQSSYEDRSQRPSPNKPITPKTKENFATLFERRDLYRKDMISHQESAEKYSKNMDFLQSVRTDRWINRVKLFFRTPKQLEGMDTALYDRYNQGIDRQNFYRELESQSSLRDQAHRNLILTEIKILNVQDKIGILYHDHNIPGYTYPEDPFRDISEGKDQKLFQHIDNNPPPLPPLSSQPLSHLDLNESEPSEPSHSQSEHPSLADDTVIQSSELDR